MSAGMGRPSPKVSNDLGLLAPAFRAAVEAAITECKAKKLDVLVYETYRSQEMQALYYARGRTIVPPTHTVTNAPTNLQSWHGFGLAVDVVHRTDYWEPPGGLKWFQEVAEVFKANNCKWGGDWTKPDPPHFQWRLCKPSPSDYARQLLKDGGFPSVWAAVGADLQAVPANVAANLAPAATPPAPEPAPGAIAWGAKVSPEFRKKVVEICGPLELEPDDLMACMAFESGESFDPAKKNAAGSNATGLIQFMPATAKGLRTTVEDLARMTAVQQLDYVAKYFSPQKGRLKDIGDVYMAILWPPGIGKSDDWVLFDKGDTEHPARYAQNAGLDTNKNLRVTRGEACAKIKAKLVKGRLPENRA